MKKNYYVFSFVIVISILLYSCTKRQTPVDAFSDLYNIHNNYLQGFDIDPTIDNVITSSAGTKVRIDKNTFVDSAGVLAKGRVEITIRECFSKMDWIKGNMTTTYGGKPLETGGMLYIAARIRNQEGGNDLEIASAKQIYISIPSDSTLPGMLVFEGKEEAGEVKWSNPLPIQKGIIINNRKKRKKEADVIIKDERATNIRYRVDGFDNALDAPKEVQDEVSTIAWAGNGLKLSRDSVFKIGDYTVHFIKVDTFFRYSESYTVKKGTNTYIADKNSSYIFSIKKLGWANIDRLLEDPRTKEVELVTVVENEGDFDFAYITMVTKRMYLPGYQKGDDTYSFTHGDEEKTRLPVGEVATIIGTAYKGNKIYFGIRKFEIKEKQEVSFKLEETSKDGMYDKLEREI